ncbi:hypothetical protein P7D93_19035 [Enterococcus raffinosus]|uniref:hypothetical protein n=1 Tax=Enterococcus raffinosus TaxID=71452 RepID=UPI002891DDDB|nr:hypothetical protein [Enterococcus raffinosus]MDT2531958.1 hypothetical protein [Enterococcus raffinosus]
MSTTSKIKNELVRLLSLEENKAGLTFSQVWKKLEQTDFSKELYNDNGEKRLGTLVGLTTRIKKNKIEGLKVVKVDNQLLYVGSNNELEFLINTTKKYLNQVINYQLNDEYTKLEESSILEFKQVLSTLNKATKQVESASFEKNATELKTTKVEIVPKEKNMKKAPVKETKKEESKSKKKKSDTKTTKK